MVQTEGKKPMDTREVMSTHVLRNNGVIDGVGFRPRCNALGMVLNRYDGSREDGQVSDDEVGNETAVCLYRTDDSRRAWVMIA